MTIKVEESMENLEEVVKERNRAYYQLEVGITGDILSNICFCPAKYQLDGRFEIPISITAVLNADFHSACSEN